MSDKKFEEEILNDAEGANKTEVEDSVLTEVEAQDVTEIEAEKTTDIEAGNGVKNEAEKAFKNGTAKEIDESEIVTEIEEKSVSKFSTSFKVESLFNGLVHILNGAVACALTLHLIREVLNGWPSTNDLFPLHAFLTTVGYQLFMAEAILVYYTPNSWSYFLSYKTKKHLHWILHLIGAIFIISGNVLISVIRTTPHFATVHSITGLLLTRINHKVSIR